MDEPGTRDTRLMSTKTHLRPRAVACAFFTASIVFPAFSLGVSTDTNTASLSTINEAAESVELYQGPRILKHRNPKYPYEQQLANGEGWVVMQYMVDTAGKPYEISVVDSVGSDSFSKSAVTALRRYTFQPAMVDGQAIDAGHRHKVVFGLEGGKPGAKWSFVTAFKKLSKAIQASDKTEADQLFAKLKITNLYEDAFYNYMRAWYYVRWGTPKQQLASVRRAVAHENSGKYLRESQYLTALQLRFKLEVALKDFAAAESTAALLLEHEKDEAQLAIVQNATKQLAELRDSSLAYTVTGDLGKDTSWWYGLFRNRFQVSITEGRIAELKLRCRKGYVFFRYEAGLEYSVPKDHMPCGLEVLGDPGTRFSISQ